MSEHFLSTFLSVAIHWYYLWENWWHQFWRLFLDILNFPTVSLRPFVLDRIRTFEMFPMWFWDLVLVLAVHVLTGMILWCLLTIQQFQALFRLNMFWFGRKMQTYLFSFVLPVSITNTTSGIVIPVSAIFVAKTIWKHKVKTFR